MLNEAGPHIDEMDWLALLAKVKERLPHVQWMTVGGSLPPGAPRDAYKTLIELAHAAGISCVLDSDGAPMIAGMQAKPTLIKPNEKEAERLLSRPLHSDEQFFEAAQELAEHEVPYVIISRGARGADACTPEGLLRCRPPEVHVRSTIGSGDSMIGGILHILMQGGDIQEALRWGTAAGAATATTNGAEIARREMVLELLDQVKIEKYEKKSL